MAPHPTRRRLFLAVALAAAPSAVACGPAPRDPLAPPASAHPPVTDVATVAPSATSAHVLPADVDFEITVSPEPSPDALVRVEADEIGTPELTFAASSFGLGPKVQATARGADLRDAFFLAGLLGRAKFHAPEGNDEAAWLGYTAFDPRPVVADMAGLRTAL